MPNPTINDGIQVMIDQTISQQPRPIKVLITKKYNDGHVDVKTLNEDKLEYIAYIGNPTVNKWGILFTLENDEKMVIA